MNPVAWPSGNTLHGLAKQHRRREFRCGERQVDEWLATKALQHQEKHLSVTKVLLGDGGVIAGFYTLATGQVDFGDLPASVAKRLPKRLLPIAILAWLGVDARFHRHGFGRLLVAQALRDCYDAGKTFPFVAVVLDCIKDAAKAFYRQWDFEELPGNPSRLFLSAARLAAMMQSI